MMMTDGGVAPGGARRPSPNPPAIGRTAGADLAAAENSARPAPAAPSADVDLGTQPIARQQPEGTLKGKLPGVLCGDPPPDDDQAVDLLDGQVPDAVVGRPTDPLLHLF